MASRYTFRYLYRMFFSLSAGTRATIVGRTSSNKSKPFPKKIAPVTIPAVKATELIARDTIVVATLLVS